MNDFEFDDYLEAQVKVPGAVSEVILALPEDLDLAEISLSQDYLNSIQDFINSADLWLPKAEGAIKAELSAEISLRLVRIYVLSDQDETEMIFGLSFWVSADIEHGRGMKMAMQDFNIVEYGLAELAFC